MCRKNCKWNVWGRKASIWGGNCPPCPNVATCLVYAKPAGQAWYRSCEWSWPGRGRALWRWRSCAAGWRRGPAARSTATFPGARRRCFPVERRERGSPWRGQAATPCRPGAGSRFAASCPSGRGCWARRRARACPWCTWRSPRDSPGWCLCAVWPAGAKPTCVSRQPSRSERHPTTHCHRARKCAALGIGQGPDCDEFTIINSSQRSYDELMIIKSLKLSYDERNDEVMTNLWS